MNKDTLHHANPRYLAQDILSRRNHTEKELRRKLQQKGIAGDEADETIAWVKQKKYLNDKAMAVEYIERTITHKWVGPMWIKNKLRQKGIDTDTIQEALREAYPDKEALKAKAAAAWKKQHPKKSDDKLRLRRFLISRGF